MTIDISFVARSNNPYAKQMRVAESTSRISLVYSVAYNLFASLGSFALIIANRRNWSYSKMYMHLSYLSLRATFFPRSTLFKTKEEVVKKYIEHLADSPYESIDLFYQNSEFRTGVNLFIELSLRREETAVLEMIETNVERAVSAMTTTQRPQNFATFLNEAINSHRLSVSLGNKLSDLKNVYQDRSNERIREIIRSRYPTLQEFEFSGIKYLLSEGTIAFFEKLGDESTVKIDKDLKKITLLPGKTKELFIVLLKIFEGRTGQFYLNLSEFTEIEKGMIAKIMPKLNEADPDFFKIHFLDKIEHSVMHYSPTLPPQYEEVVFQAFLLKKNWQGVSSIMKNVLGKMYQDAPTISTELLKKGYDSLPVDAKKGFLAHMSLTYFGGNTHLPVFLTQRISSLVRRIESDHSFRELFFELVGFFTKEKEGSTLIKHRFSWHRRAWAIGLPNLKVFTDQIEAEMRRKIDRFDNLVLFEFLLSLGALKIADIQERNQVLLERDDCFWKIKKLLLTYLIEHAPELFVTHPEETKEIFVNDHTIQVDYHDDLFKLLKVLIDKKNVLGFNRLAVECSGNHFLLSHLKASFEDTASSFVKLVEAWMNLSNEECRATVFNLMELCPIDPSLCEADYLNLPTVRDAYEDLVAFVEEMQEEDRFILENRDQVQKCIGNYVKSLPLSEVENRSNTFPVLFGFLEFSRKHNFSALLETCMDKILKGEYFVLYLKELKAKSTKEEFEKHTEALTEIFESYNFDRKCFGVHQLLRGPEFNRIVRGNDFERKEKIFQIAEGILGIITLSEIRKKFDDMQIGKSADRILKTNKESVINSLKREVIEVLPKKDKEVVEEYLRKERDYFATLGMAV